MIPHNLAPHAEMELACACIRDAYTTVFNYYHAPEMRVKFIQFTSAIVLLHKPYMLLTQKGMEELSAQVFTDDDYRDFTLSLTYNFFIRLGDNSTNLANLCRAIANTADVLPDNGSLIPLEVAARLTNKSLLNVLQKNKWLVTILIMQAYIAIPYTPPKVKGAPDGQG